MFRFDISEDCKTPDCRKQRSAYGGEYNGLCNTCIAQVMRDEEEDDEVEFE